MAAPFAAQVGNLAAHPFKVAQLGLNMLHQQLARRVQPDATRQAFEDRAAEIVLEMLDSPVQRRAGDVHVLGGAADRTGAGHVSDHAEGLQVAHRSLQVLQNLQRLAENIALEVTA